jgi:hypothetical protein
MSVPLIEGLTDKYMKKIQEKLDLLNITFEDLLNFKYNKNDQIESIIDKTKENLKAYNINAYNECLCGHIIKNHKVISNDIIHLIVGACCVKRFIKKDNQISKCKRCNMDHNKRVNSLCEPCKRFSKWTMPMGKYKNHNLYDLYNGDKTYFMWMFRESRKTQNEFPLHDRMDAILDYINNI